jgi:hypothetical protein
MPENRRIDIEKILVLGAGQLGLAVLRQLVPRVEKADTPVTVLLAPKSVEDPTPQDHWVLAELRALGVTILAYDLGTTNVGGLTKLFAGFNTIVNCTGFVAGPGTQLKITRAVLNAGVPRYFPWQFGVDYDIVGKGSGQPVFDEQYEVRTLLRSQEATEWVIVSTGMFTSFLFEPAFDVVDLDKKIVRGLGTWDTRVTVTTLEDIGLLTTAILLEEPRIANEVVFVASDTISYGELADVVETQTGAAIKRVMLPLEQLQNELALSPDDVMLRYRAAFALGDGMWWDFSQTYNHQRAIETQNVRSWLKAHLARKMLTRSEPNVP